MAHELALAAKKRTNTGKTGSKQLRKSGLIPSVLYSKDKEPVMLEVNHKDWYMTFRHQTMDGVIVNLDVDGENCACLIKEAQIDRLTGKCIHLDFMALDLSKTIRTEVHVETTGDVVAGGLVEHVKRTIEIECLPTDMPEVIKVDISGLELDGSICVKDLKVADSIKVLTDAEAKLVCIVAPKEEKEPEDSEEEETASAEPEVISKGKKEEEE